MCVPGCEEAVRHALTRRGFFAGAGTVAAAFAATPVAAQVPRTFRSVVDLTHVMSADFPTFFGVPGIEMQKQFDIAKDGFNLYWWRIIEHAGTHLDAPIHFSTAGATVDKIDVGSLVAPLAVVDVKAKAAQNPDYLLSRQDLADWEARNGRLPDGCCVAMNSGWAEHVASFAKFSGKDAAGVLHFPGFALGGRGVAACASATSPGSRSTRCRSITGRRRISRPTICGCRRVGGGSRTSPISTGFRRPARRWWSASPR